MRYRVIVIVLIVLLTCLILNSCRDVQKKAESNLEKWRKGVWISGNSTYTIYTDSHYFVISMEGDSSRANLYIGASQLGYFKQGMTRKQISRFRKYPGGDPVFFADKIFTENHNEQPLNADTSRFTPGTCNIVDGIIYDVIIEETDEYILLATCNGDKEKIYADGRSAYLPASGGEYFSYRIERF
jgi:hypothetical protein